MKLAKIVPFLMLPVLAIGCAQAGEDDAAADEGAFTAAAAAKAEVTASVGAVVINGKKICTAALVDVDAGAMIKIGDAEVSARGRQVLMGGACIGKLTPNFTGVAAFVTHQGSLAVSTPFLSIDFKDRETLGVAVGILSAAPEGSTPAELASADDVRGFFASANAGASFASVFEANEDGIAFGAAAEIHGGVSFALKTRCTSFAFQAQAGIAVGAGVRLGNEGLGATAFIRVHGKLRLAAHIDGGCIVKHVAEKLAKISAETIKAANILGDKTNSIGTGDVIGVYRQGQNALLPDADGFATVSVRVTKDASVLRVNAQGHVTATTKGATCDKIPLLFIGGPCELAPAAGFKAGELLTVRVDLHHDLFPSPTGTRVVLSTASSAKFPETHQSSTETRQPPPASEAP